MRRSIKNNHVLAALASLLVGLSAQSLAQTDDPPATNQGPDGLDKTSDAIVGDGADLGPNEISFGNAIEILCPKLVARIPQPAPTPPPSSTPNNNDEEMDDSGNQITGEEINLNRGDAVYAANGRSAEEVDLQRRCTEVVQYRRRTAGTGDEFTPLNTVLRELNVDEAAAQNRGLVELAGISTAAVIGRLEQLRLADAGRRDEVLAYQSGPGEWTYHFETGGAAGDGDFGRWSIYLNGELFSGDRDQTALEAGFDLDGGRLTVGTDYRVNDNTFVGASLDYITSGADFDNGSELDADGIDITLYGTSYTDGGLYFQGTAGIGFNNYEQDRVFRYTTPAVPPPAGVGGAATTVNQIASSDTDGDQYYLSGGIGKDIDLGSGILANFTADLAYLDASVDGFTETVTGAGPGLGMGLRVRDQDIESLRSSLGAQISKTISTETGVIVPFARADWLHEFENDSRVIVASFANDTLFPSTTTFGLTTEEPDEDYFRIGGGLSAVFAGGLQGFVSIDSVLGLDDFSYYSITAGISKEL